MVHPQAPKTVLCIHDLSGAGRCSLAVILPVLAALGCQAVALPTAVLSTHTGGLGQPAALGCQEYARQALAHYKSLGLEFDCIYSGYLGTAAQQQLVLDAFAAWPTALKVVDPVLGDDGRLYAGMEPLVEGMQRLCSAADLIAPNLTEAGLLLGQPYPQAPLEGPQAQALAAQLAQRFGGSAVLTGLSMGKYIACAGAGHEEFLQKRQRLPQNFPGTGDLFGAALVGGLLRGNALSAAMDAAAGFVAAAITATPADADPRLGVWFESQLYRLVARG